MTRFAQAGRGTDLVCLGPKDSWPRPNPAVAAGLPEGRGVKIPTIAVSFTRYSRATRFTSATVTFWMAAMSSSGELRPSTATACDHSDANPEMELRRNWASASSCRLAASTRSGGTPFAT